MLYYLATITFLFLLNNLLNWSLLNRAGAKANKELSAHNVTNLMLKLSEWKLKLDAINKAKLKLDKDLIGLNSEPVDYVLVSRILDILEVN